MKTKQVMARTHKINTAPPTTEMPMIVSLLKPSRADGSGKGASGTEKKKRDYEQIRLNALLLVRHYAVWISISKKNAKYR